MKVIITTVDHDAQRYNTCGDWLLDGDTLLIKVSATSDWRGSMLIAVHELVETLLCKHRGVTQLAVDQFDLAFGDPIEGEPGDDPKAPYHREHCTATGIERILAAELDVDWQTYENEIDKMTRAYRDNGQHSASA